MKLALPLLKATFWGAVLCVPVAGIWIASSLAAYHNGPTWLAIAVALLFFPVLPLTWEAWSARRRSRKKERKKGGSFFDDMASRRRTERALTFGDRLLMRTLSLNLVFVLGLLALSPRTAFNALTARGDWFLDDIEQSWVPAARLAILRGADKAEWLANLQEPNPWADGEEPTEVAPEPVEEAPERVSVSVLVPDGAIAQLGEELPPIRVEGAATADLVPDVPLAIRVIYDDGRKEICTFTPLADDDSVDFVERDGALFLREGPTQRPCIRMQQADPDWTPELHLLDWGGKVLGAPIAGDDIHAVKIREPYYRVELTVEAGDRLCELTRKHPNRPLALVVDGEIRFRTPRDSQTQCTGSVSFPMFDLPEGAVPPEEPPEKAHGQWPMKSEVHPLLIDFPEEHAASISLVGKYIRANEDDPWQRVKAIHDYVVLNVSYDDSSLESGRRAPQDADTVFRTGTGVCAGYAHLMVAIGQASGDEIVYVTGDARQDLGDIGGAPHAWNAAKIDDQWVLIDATWDVGNKSSGSFEARYSTDYLFTPPEVFRLSHRPDDDRWQLAAPMGLGEFNRQPLLRPAFFAADLGLTDPNRAQVTVSGDAVIRLSNPKGTEIRAEYDGLGGRKRCEVDGKESVSVTCRFPKSGTYDVLLFHEAEDGAFDFGGRIQFNR